MWGMLPAVIYPAATLARGGDLAHAHALLPMDDGRWISIEAAPLDGDRDGDIAVTIRTAGPARRSPWCAGRTGSRSARPRSWRR